MEITHKFKLHKRSEEIIKETYDMYTEVEWEDNKVFNNPLIHMTPTGDTRDDEGDLNGFTDALLFTLMIFDQSNMTVMKLENRDQLDTFYEKYIHLHSMRLFKDGSTFIKLRGRYKFGDTQAVTIYPIDVK